MAFDGVHIWVTEIGQAKIAEFNLDGTGIIQYTSGSARGVAFDGTAIWTANAFGTVGSIEKQDLGGKKTAKSR